MNTHKQLYRFDPRDVTVCMFAVITAVATLTVALIGAFGDDKTMRWCAYMLPVIIGTGTILIILAIVLPIPFEDDQDNISDYMEDGCDL